MQTVNRALDVLALALNKPYDHAAPAKIRGGRRHAPPASKAPRSGTPGQKQATSPKRRCVTSTTKPGPAAPFTSAVVPVEVPPKPPAHPEPLTKAAAQVADRVVRTVVKTRTVSEVQTALIMDALPSWELHVHQRDLLLKDHEDGYIRSLQQTMNDFALRQYAQPL